MALDTISGSSSAMTSIRLFLLLFSLLNGLAETRKYRKSNEVGIVNLAEANLRLRCQSILEDHKDHFLAPTNQFRFKFYDIDLGNHNFWCDAYGLFGFFETFDVFGRAAPSRSNITWFIKKDGLYMNNEFNRLIEWTWNYSAFSSYVE